MLGLLTYVGLGTLGTANPPAKEGGAGATTGGTNGGNAGTGLGLNISNMARSAPC
jgi:hypothetical protein